MIPSDSDTAPTPAPADVPRAPARAAHSQGGRGKLVVAAGVALVAGFIFWRFGGLLSLEALAVREADLQSLLNSRPVLVYSTAFLIYVAVTALSLPGALVLTLAYGWCFKLVPGVILASFASTTGATLAFLLSRYLFRDAVRRKFGARLGGFEQALQREGPFFLFTLRLIPVVPFFVINLVMGLTPIGVGTFWWISQLGMLAGTIVYVYVGSVVPSLQTLAERGVGAVLAPGQLAQITAALAALGLFPWLTRRLIAKFRKADGAAATVTATAAAEPRAAP